MKKFLNKEKSLANLYCTLERHGRKHPPQVPNVCARCTKILIKIFFSKKSSESFIWTLDSSFDKSGWKSLPKSQKLFARCPKFFFFENKKFLTSTLNGKKLANLAKNFYPEAEIFSLNHTKGHEEQSLAPKGLLDT